MGQPAFWGSPPFRMSEMWKRPLAIVLLGVGLAVMSGGRGVHMVRQLIFISSHNVKPAERSALCQKQTSRVWRDTPILIAGQKARIGQERA
jgi:hypothetical protein